MNGSQCKHPARRLSAQLSGVLLLGALLAPTAATAANETQKTFATPEAAVEALIAGLAQDGPDALLDIFGHEHQEQLIGTDKVASRISRKRAHEAATKMHRLRNNGDDRLTLIIGPKAWPVPFPLVKEGDAWRFDTEAGLDELINRRIGENELSAIETLNAYVAAQELYASVDRDGDEVREYAQLLGSTPGQRDGLYWEADPDSAEISPFGPLLAEAEEYLGGREAGDPFKGYYYRIITRQGSRVPGGRYDYVINGNMIAGFSLVAYPADYGISGIMSFVVSHQGKVYEKDLGDDTYIRGLAMESYNPDDSWAEVGN